jgi:hypothetical protein
MQMYSHVNTFQIFTYLSTEEQNILLLHSVNVPQDYKKKSSVRVSEIETKACEMPF